MRTEKDFITVRQSRNLTSRALKKQKGPEQRTLRMFWKEEQPPTCKAEAPTTEIPDKFRATNEALLCPISSLPESSDCFSSYSACGWNPGLNIGTIRGTPRPYIVTK